MLLVCFRSCFRFPLLTPRSPIVDPHYLLHSEAAIGFCGAPELTSLQAPRSRRSVSCKKRKRNSMLRAVRFELTRTCVQWRVSCSSNHEKQYLNPPP